MAGLGFIAVFGSRGVLGCQPQPLQLGAGFPRCLGCFGEVEKMFQWSLFGSQSQHGPSVSREPERCTTVVFATPCTCPCRSSFLPPC